MSDGVRGDAGGVRFKALDFREGAGAGGRGGGVCTCRVGRGDEAGEVSNASSDIDARTDAIFLQRHPERGGRRISRDEPNSRRLIAEWLQIRRTLAAQSAPSSSAAPSLGALSRKYESGRNGVGTIGRTPGDPGGASYGIYQIATKTGTMKGFLSFLSQAYPDLFRALSAHTPGSSGFDGAWKELARRDPDRFERAQHAFIEASHYRPARDRLAQALSLDVDRRSATLRDVVWSTAVQHGSGGALRVFRNALGASAPASLSDEELIRRVYQERGAEGGRRHFPRASESVRRAVVQRFEREARDALAMLQAEHARGASPAPASAAPSGNAAPPGEIVSVRGIAVARQIAPALERLLAAAEADGIRLSGHGHRSRARQIELRKKHCGPTEHDIWQKPAKACNPPTAIPGRSNHERGLAIDFSSDGRSLTSDSAAFRWLRDNAARFGFKNLPSEPWHWSVDGR